jgi:hypothetical protein
MFGDVSNEEAQVLKFPDPT